MTSIDEARVREILDGARHGPVGLTVPDADLRALCTLALERLASRQAALYRHVKRGTEYVLLGFGKMQADSWFDAPMTLQGNASVDMREVAIYRSVDDGSMWVRPREEFEDGRFVVLAQTKPKGETR